MHDAHFHISETWDGLAVQGIVNASSVEEYEKVKNIHRYISVGIHPWYANEQSYEEMLPYFDKVDIIGEIGLDNTWCQTNIQLQMDIFDKQLFYAYTNKKTVLLHTKGMEKEVYLRISKYPNIYIVHWYSTKEWIQEYIDLDCYFTIGPSIGIDEAVDEVCRLCPIERLLIESDGLDAIAWAYNCSKEEVNYVDALKRSIEQIAKIKNMSYEDVERQLDKNFMNIVKKAG